MKCQDTQQLIHAYLDGELDLVKSLEVERHLPECAACTQAYNNQRVLHSALSADTLYYKAPASLRKRVQSSVRQTNHTTPAPRVSAWRWLGAAAALVVIALMTWGALRGLSAPSADDLLAQQVVASHVRSLMPNHLADVASSDQHTVKPWFDGKLDFAPAVTDFTEQGFPLIGGRLDYLDNRPVAALIYKRQQHLINVFSWPSPGIAATNPTAVMRQGYHVFHWIQADMAYWVVSDLNETELQEFVRLLQNQTPS